MKNKNPKALMSRDERKAVALAAALKLAAKCGAERVSLAAVAAAIKVTAPLLFHIFGTRMQFVAELKKAAKKAGTVLPPPVPLVRAPRPVVKAAVVKKATPVVKPPVKKVTPAVKVGALPRPKKVGAAPAKTLLKKPTPPVKVAKKTAPVVKKPTPPKAIKATAPMSAADKFKSLPKPFEAAVQQVA